MREESKLPASSSQTGMSGVKTAWFRARVCGRVQGVGYRMWAVETGRKLGVTGWVRNVTGGDVEVEAEGNLPDLELFVDKLRQGPTLSQVREVVVDWGERAPRYFRFYVEY